MKRIKTAFTTKDVSNITGISPRNVISYSAQKIILPRVSEVVGTGNHKVYDIYNLFEFHMVERLKECGMSMTVIREILGWLRQQEVIKMLAELISNKIIQCRLELSEIRSRDDYNYEDEDTGINYELFPKRKKSELEEIERRMFPRFFERNFEKMTNPYARSVFLLHLIHECFELNDIAEENKQEYMELVEPFLGFFADDIMPGRFKYARSSDAIADDIHNGKYDFNKPVVIEKYYESLILKIYDGKDYRLVLTTNPTQESPEDELHTIFIKANLFNIFTDCYSKMLSMKTTEYFRLFSYPILRTQKTTYLKGGE